MTLKDIDYIVIQHAEIDHSGALLELMKEIPDTPIYCTKNGEKIIRGHFHQDWNIVTVKTGDTLDIGESKLIFVEAPMLHWPDTMFTYMTGENIPSATMPLVSTMPPNRCTTMWWTSVSCLPRP